MSKPDIEKVENYSFESHELAVSIMGSPVLQRVVCTDPPFRVDEDLAHVPVEVHYRTEVLELKQFAVGSNRFWRYIKQESKQ